MKNQFEQHIKESLEKFEVKYDPAHWADMNKRLDKINTPAKDSNIGRIIGIAAGVMVVAGLVYFFSTNSSETTPIEKTGIATENNNNEAAQPSLETAQSENQGQAPSAQVSNIQSGGSENTRDQSTNKNTATNAPVVKTESQPANNNVADGKTVNTNTEQQVVVNTPQTEADVNTPSPKASFILAQTPCAGVEITFIADKVAMQCTHRWEFGDGKTSGEQSPTHTYQRPGTYPVKLTLTSAKDKKVVSEATKEIVINPSPVIEMNYSAAEDVPSLINFEAKDGNVKEWSWNFGSIGVSKDQNPSFEFTKKGNYDVVVTAINVFGCSNSLRRLVRIENVFPLAPEAFSPNGDGINETWMPSSLVNGDFNFILVIYDRTGKEVYRTSDKNQPWNGGGNLNAGDSFSWKAVVKERNGKTYSGTITIAP